MIHLKRSAPNKQTSAHRSQRQRHSKTTYLDRTFTDNRHRCLNDAFNLRTTVWLLKSQGKGLQKLSSGYFFQVRSSIGLFKFPTKGTQRASMTQGEMNKSICFAVNQDTKIHDLGSGHFSQIDQEKSCEPDSDNREETKTTVRNNSRNSPGKARRAD